MANASIVNYLSNVNAGTFSRGASRQAPDAFHRIHNVTMSRCSPSSNPFGNPFVAVLAPLFVKCRQVEDDSNKKSQSGNDDMAGDS
jgi:hypothetical protein